MIRFQIPNSKFQISGVNILLLFVFYFLFNTVSAQSVSASLDRDKILLGEQVTLQFNLSNINESLFFVDNWPQLNDTIARTEILKRSSIDTINVNGYNTYRQNFILTSFDSGRWQLGPFIFELQDKLSGKKTQLATDPLYLVVLPVDVSSMKDYHPLKDIIGVETNFNWMPVFIAIAVILLAAVIIFFIKKKKHKIITAPKLVLKGTPLERALEKLHALEKEPLTTITQIKNLHLEADITIRKYFEEMININALQLTATELFSRFNIYLQQEQLRSKFQEVFELNQSVKFAKYMPGEEQSKSMLGEIIKGLYQIDESINIAKNNAERLVPKY